MSVHVVNDDDGLPSIGTIQHYVSLVREGKPDPEGSKQLLRVFCARAKNLSFPTSPFPEPLLELMVSAFEKYLSGEEENINKSLGLVRRGRPKDPEIEKRNQFIAADIFRLVEAGENKTVSGNSDGAFYTIAQKYSLSESEVEDIYYKFEKEGMIIVLLERLNSDPA